MELKFARLKKTGLRIAKKANAKARRAIRPERRIFISVAIIDSDWLKTPASFYRCVQDQESGNPGADFRTPQPRAG
jgi:hypothetical protein